MAVRRKSAAVLQSWGSRLNGQLLYDSFTRTNGTPVSASTCDTGQVWSGSTVATISGGTILPGGAFSAEYIQIDCGSADYTAQCTVAAVDSAKFPQLDVRYLNFNNYILLQMNDATHYYLGTRVAGAFTQLALVATTPTIGDVLKIKVSGSTVTAWINGTQIYSGTPAGISTTATKVAVAQDISGVGKFDDLIVVAN